MSTALTTQTEFTDERRELIRKTVAKDLTPVEFDAFIEYCARTQLNPIAKQIYAIKRGGVLGIQASIDGLRLIAARTGEYQGQVGPQWCGKDGKWTDVWLESSNPVASRVGVLRNGFREPLYAVAKWDSYSQATPIWKKMPDLMLAKCAESLALRKAFPAEMSGVYSEEEMQQAETHKPNTLDGNGDTTPRPGYLYYTHRGKHCSQVERDEGRDRLESERDRLAKIPRDEAQRDYHTIDEYLRLSDAIPVESREVEPEEPSDSAEPVSKVPVCGCGGVYVKSRNKPVYYCPNFKEPGVHGKSVPSSEVEG